MREPGLMNLTIRRAEDEEAALVADLNGFVQGMHHEQRPDWFKPPDAAGFLPVVKAWLSSPSTALFVGHESDCELLGYSVGVRHERPDNSLVRGASFVELDQVVVVPTARRRGIGQALCSAVIDWADSKGADRVELSTWAFNDAVYGVFESLGFTPTFRRMSRPLRPDL